MLKIPRPGPPAGCQMLTDKDSINLGQTGYRGEKGEKEMFPSHLEESIPDLLFVI